MNIKNIKQTKSEEITSGNVQRELRKYATPQRAKVNAWFFKSGEGQYGEGDKFLGLSVPQQRTIAHRFRDLPLSEIKKLLASPYHEDRFTALEILVMQYETHSRSSGQAEIVKFYLSNVKYINNWDLVDTSAPYILGHWLYQALERSPSKLQRRRRESTLLKLAKSENLWERRIAIVSTQYFINKQRFNETLQIAEQLIADTHDLIQKATGWMLREVGKRNVKTLEIFLQKYAIRMPRTMLRYAIEKFSPEKRLKYMSRNNFLDIS